MDRRPFLRIPPFPRHRAKPLAVASGSLFPDSTDMAPMAERLAALKVGGNFWAARPVLPIDRRIILAPDTQRQAQGMIRELVAQGLAAQGLMIGPFASGAEIPVISQLCDPWHLAQHAVEVRAGAEQELALVAALCCVPVRTCGTGRFDQLSSLGLHRTLANELCGAWSWREPFTEAVIDEGEAIALLGEWRRLLDSNRQIAGIFGVGLWKRVTVDNLLWDGSEPVRHRRPGDNRTASLLAGSRVLVWKSRTAPELPERLTARGIAVGEIEDGMIRSIGLGANCVPPLSVITDFSGIYFDPQQSSDLEALLQGGHFSPVMLRRAAMLRQRLVQEGISKYGKGTAALPEPGNARQSGSAHRVLVVGQVEDDRSILTGGAGLTNLTLLQQARACHRDGYLIYKPHPDVEAGHRKGAIPDALVCELADEIERAAPIGDVLDRVDGVHVITSLTGFEALMRGKDVTAHGVPFYAGWGLTTDLGAIPARRTRRCTLDELVAATLLLYPRYVDPVTRLPCPPEVLVERMASGRAQVASPLIALRTLQGRVQRMRQNWRQRRQRAGG